MCGVLYKTIILVVVQLLSHVQLFVNPWTSLSMLPCPSLSPRVCSNSCPLSLWHHPTISFSVSSFSSCSQSFPASGSFPVCWLFPSDGQITGASGSASVLPLNIQGWFSLGLTGLISAVQGTLGSLLQHHNSKASKVLNLLYGPNFTFIYDYWKNHCFTIWTFISKVNSLLFNMLYRFVIAFLPRSNRLNFMAAVTICSDFGGQENKICHF